MAKNQSATSQAEVIIMVLLYINSGETETQFVVEKLFQWHTRVESGRILVEMPDDWFSFVFGMSAPTNHQFIPTLQVSREGSALRFAYTEGFAR